MMMSCPTHDHLVLGDRQNGSPQFLNTLLVMNGLEVGYYLLE